MRKKVIAALLGLGLIVTNLYWRRRLSAVQQSLTRSMELGVKSAKANENGQSAQQTLREAAKQLDTSPEELPTQISSLDEKVRSLNNDMNRLRGKWVESWWNARMADSLATDEPHEITVTLSDVTMDELTAFAKQATKHDKGITIVVDDESGNFAVTVGDHRQDSHSAENIAKRIADSIGGGAGGSPTLATGGGPSTPELSQAAETILEELSQST